MYWPHAILRKITSSAILFATIIIATHVYFFMIDGATFWIDSIAYVNLGSAMFSPDHLSAFYQDTGRWFYSHVQPGLPLFWALLEAIPNDLRWPVFAILQHSVAIGATYYAFMTIYRYWPSKWHYLWCALLCLLPYYQAFHNSFMSESLTSSILLIAFATWIKLIKNSQQKAPYLHYYLMMLLLIITQLRSYMVVPVFVLGMLAIVFRKEVLTHYFKGYILTALVAVLLFPTYRYVMTGEFFTPNSGLNKLVASLWFNPNISLETQKKIQHIGQFGNMDLMSHKDIGYADMISLGSYWKKNGLNNATINNTSVKIGNIILNDARLEYKKRLLMALSSNGLVLPYCMIKIPVKVHGDLNAEKLCLHLLNHYAYLGWIDIKNHESFITSFFASPTPFDQMPNWNKSKDSLKFMLSPYVNSFSITYKDPIFIGKLAPDIWVMMWLAGMLWLLRNKHFSLLVIGFGVVFISNFFVCLTFPVGNIRYAYVLFPLYFLGISMALSQTRATSYDRR